jgi:hypothetical protein
VEGGHQMEEVEEGGFQMEEVEEGFQLLVAAEGGFHPVHQVRQVHLHLEEVEWRSQLWEAEGELHSELEEESRSGEAEEGSRLKEAEEGSRLVEAER